MKKDSSKERTQKYRERQKEKQEAAADAAEETAKIKELNLCSFAETAFDTPARSCDEEIQVHRGWLRAMGQPDMLPNETLRQLAQRTWTALLNSKGLGVFISGNDVWFPLFVPSAQNFQGWFGDNMHGAANPEWFDAHWIPPNCSGDDPIDIRKLPKLPLMKSNREMYETRLHYMRSEV